MYQEIEIRSIHGRRVTIQRKCKRSILPSYFFGKKYAHIETTMSYKEHEKQIVIIIPHVDDERLNRRRSIQVKINNENFCPKSPKAQTILDMTNTFDLTDMPVLIDFAIIDKNKLAEDSTQRFCLPSLVRPDAIGEVAHRTQTYPYSTQNWRHILKNDRGFVLYQDQLFEFAKDKLTEITGNKKSEIESRLKNNPYNALDGISFYANVESDKKDAIMSEISFSQTMEKIIRSLERGDNRAKELIFPIARKGLPHHWEVCVLRIDEDNISSLTIIETSSLEGISKEIFRQEIEAYYTNNILNFINSILKENQYSAIKPDQVFFHTHKQFSLRGCGIAASIHIQHLLNGRLPNIGKPISQFEQIAAQHYASISIEEDALRRVQLARYFEINQTVNSEKVQPFDFKQELNPNISEKAQVLVKRLEQYIARIKQKHLDNQNPFNQGFSFLSRSQALNRKANYFLAQHLLFRLRRGDQLDKIFDQTSLREQRASILERYRISQDKCYANRGMNSQELRQIIQDARTTLSPANNKDVNSHFFHTNFFKGCLSCFKLNPHQPSTKIQPQATSSAII